MLRLSNKPLIGDIICGLAVVVIAAITAVCLFFTSSGGGERTVVITYGEEIMRYPIDAAASCSVNGVDIVIESGYAYVSDSDCSDKICVNTGKISRVGQAVVCLPNKVSVTIDGKGGDVIVAG